MGWHLDISEQKWWSHLNCQEKACKEENDTQGEITGGANQRKQALKGDLSIRVDVRIYTIDSQKAWHDRQ